MGKQAVKKAKKKNKQEESIANQGFYFKRISDVGNNADQSLLLVNIPSSNYHNNTINKISNKQGGLMYESDTNGVYVKKHDGQENERYFADKEDKDENSIVQTDEDQLPLMTKPLLNSNTSFQNTNNSQRQGAHDKMLREQHNSMNSNADQQKRNYSSPDKQQYQVQKIQQPLQTNYKVNLMTYEQTLQNLRLLYKLNPAEYFDKLQQEIYGRHSPIKVLNQHTRQLNSLELNTSIKPSKKQSSEFWNGDTKPPKPHNYPTNNLLQPTALKILDKSKQQLDVSSLEYSELKKAQMILALSQKKNSKTDESFYFPTQSPSNNQQLTHQLSFQQEKVKVSKKGKSNNQQSNEVAYQSTSVLPNISGNKKQNMQETEVNNRLIEKQNSLSNIRLKKKELKNQEYQQSLIDSERYDQRGPPQYENNATLKQIQEEIQQYEQSHKIQPSPFKNKNQIKKTIQETKEILSSLKQQQLQIQNQQFQSQNPNQKSVSNLSESSTTKYPSIVNENSNFTNSVSSKMHPLNGPDLLIISDLQPFFQQQTQTPLQIKQTKFEKVKLSTSTNPQVSENHRQNTSVSQINEYNEQFLAKSKQTETTNFYKDKVRAFNTNKTSPLKDDDSLMRGGASGSKTKKLNAQQPQVIANQALVSNSNFYSTTYNNNQNNPKTQKERNQNIDTFLKVQHNNNQLVNKEKEVKERNGNNLKKEREVMRIFLKRHGYEGDDKIVFIMNSRDNFISRAAIRRGWFENPVPNSQFFDVKWDYIDNQVEFNTLQHHQFYNHFPFGRELTTKQGLNKNLNAITQHGIDIFKFYPRCYDLSEVKQIDYFLEDFKKTAILNAIKKHAKLFKRIFKDKLKNIVAEDEKILDNIFKLENKKAMKRKYHNVFPTDDEMNKLGLINTLLLQNAIFYAKNILNDINENCEGDEYIKKNFEVPRFEISNRIQEFIEIYSQYAFPLFKFKDDDTKMKRLQGWETPSFYLMFVTLKIHKELKSNIYQYKTIDDTNNIWICKPSYNARGIGIYCFNQIKDLLIGSIKKNPIPKIVQKYIERSLLLKNLNPHDPKDRRKFDIRQWVFVSSFDPLKIYIYKKAYLRICGASFDLEDISDPFKHLSNYSIQKKADSTQSQDLVMSSDNFIEYLRSEYPKHSTITWDYFYDQIYKIVSSTVGSITDTVENKANSFELYGFDFIIDKDLQCWLLEVNMSPACAERTPWLSEMLDDMSDGLLSIIEKKVIKLSQFNGALQNKAEEFQQKKVKLDNKNWVKVAQTNKAKKKNGISPQKGGVGFKVFNGNQSFYNGNVGGLQQKLQNYEIVGHKCSLKYEKKLDKLSKKLDATKFIQKIWRGYQVRKHLKLEKIQKFMREQKKRKGINLIFGTLNAICERVTPDDILYQGFIDLKYHHLITSIAQDSGKMFKIIRIQYYYRNRLQMLQQQFDEEMIQETKENSNDQNANMTILEENQEEDADKTEMNIQNSPRIKLVSRCQTSSRIINYNMVNAQQKRIMFDQDFLLDYQNLGISQKVTSSVKEVIIDKTVKTGQRKMSPRYSPYLTSMKTQFNFKKSDKKNLISKSSEANQFGNKNGINLMKTQREFIEGQLASKQPNDQSIIQKA